MRLRKESHRITLSLEMLIQGASQLPCFFGGTFFNTFRLLYTSYIFVLANNLFGLFLLFIDPKKTLEELNERFMLQLGDRDAAKYMNALINESADSWTSCAYDLYQKCCVGIY